MEVSVVKHEKMQVNFLQKPEALRKLLESRLTLEEGQNLCQIMSKLAHFHYNKKKYLIVGKERKLYNFLIENGYNPYTMYRWLLLERIPEDIKFQSKQTIVIVHLEYPFKIHSSSINFFQSSLFGLISLI
jgi:hypothetical protein